MSFITRTYLIMLRYVHSPAFLRWWNQAEFRNSIFHGIQRDQLVQNPKLLYKWWDEVKVRGNDFNVSEHRFENRLESYMRSSFKEVVNRLPPLDEVMEALMADPFLDTVFRTMGESETFADDVRPILEKLFKEFGIDS